MGTALPGAGSFRASDGTDACSAVSQERQNDGNDAKALCEAVSRPNMRFVPIKTLDQQALLALHRVRQAS